MTKTESQSAAVVCVHITIKCGFSPCWHCYTMGGPSHSAIRFTMEKRRVEQPLIKDQKKKIGEWWKKPTNFEKHKGS